MPPALVPRGLVTVLGTSQLVCWGISYYLIGVFADAIIEETGWSPTAVHGGYSLALVVMIGWPSASTTCSWPATPTRRWRC